MNYGLPLPTKIELSVYKIKSCGLYKSWNKPPLALGIKELLEQLKRWGIDSQKPLIETSTYTPSNDLDASYLWGFEFDNTTGNYLIGFWNEIENIKGSVSYVAGSKPVGNGEVTGVNAKKGDIPGFLSLFWFIPSKNIFVGIKTDEHVNTGINQLRTYLSSFGTGFSEQVIRTDPDNGEHTAFTEQKKDFLATKDERVPNSQLKASFRFPPLHINGEINFIKSHALQVTKLIRKVKVRTNQSRSLIDDVLEGIDFLFHSAPPTDKRFIKVEYPTSISPADVDIMFKDYKDNNMSESYDVTFVFSGNDIPNKSLSGARAVEKLSRFNMYYKSKDTPDLTKLLRELNTNFIASIEKLLKKANG